MARNLALEKCYVVKYGFAFSDKNETWRFMDVWMKCLNALDDFYVILVIAFSFGLCCK